tara:strand:+ start:79 stop:330 length:252 start_codon:yes stop_codon:yes gene_type:complete
MFKKIQTELEKITKKSTNPDYKEYKNIQKKWKEKIEKNIQKNIKVIDFTEGILTLKTKNTAWKNEALFLQENIKKNSQTNKTQ